ncbi:carbohydrate kinase [Rhizobium sp. TH2]|uniref:FGGY-family carbohydrate kinase n=1 Tax=Rhizobium sp. TH2 TaxID=2775403 RepID=UPI0021573E44|nr:FGGY-family carbohydrate kinase [Rhizobium sp. TH2]UVC09581.1 carbohydrate kinase [Rhizobium sp. TH2]
MGEYLLGLDAGNTVIKAVIFDLTGRELAYAAREGHSRMPKAGHVERDLNEFWANAQHVIRTCIDRSGIAADRIAAIGCAGHGNGLYALDADGAPLLGIQSLDTRASQLADELAAAGAGDIVYPIARQRPWPSQTPTLFAWLKRHDPALFQRIGTVLLCKDFITNRLTGERVSDVSDMIGAGLLDVAQRRYDVRILDAYDLGECMPVMPRLVESDEIAGRVTAEAAALTGLAEGTPVVGGLFDVIASAIGSGVTRTGAASIIAGTWSINQVIVDRPELDGPVFMSSSFDRTRYMAMENSATSAANLEWMVNQFFADCPEGTSPFDLCCNLAASVEPEIAAPFYHPFLYGAQTDGNARAGFYGVAGWHTKAHLMRAVLEGVAFGHRWHIERLRGAGASFDEAVLSGGGSRSKVWPQIIADVLGVPVSIARSHETGALGAAIAAGTGVGLFSDFTAGAASMVKLERHYAPNPTLALLCDQRYQIYCDTMVAMTPIWKRMASLGAAA